MTKKKNNLKNVNITIKKYIKNLISNNKNCDISMKKCIKPTSKSGTRIFICNNYVFKIPPKNYKQKIVVKNNTIILDNNTMNLLVQNIIKNLLKNNQDINIQIEHYEDICKYQDTYALKGKKYIIKPTITDKIITKKNFFSLEDYLINLGNFIEPSLVNKNNQEINIEIGNIVNKIYIWITQLFKELDFLFNEIQFHHVDPKSAQLFLNDNNLVLGDLDKVTFTINIGNKPYRIVLGSKIDNIMYKLANRSVPEIMRTEDMPLTSNTYEKACFLSSILLVLGKGKYIDEIREGIINKIYNNYRNIYNIIILDKLNNYLNKPLEFRKKHRSASECVLYNSVNLNAKFNIPLCNDDGEVKDDGKVKDGEVKDEVKDDEVKDDEVKDDGRI
jgi:hypothetical protein